MGNNWLPSATLKEFSQLKNLNLLDLTSNKFSGDIDKWTYAFKQAHIKNLNTISVKGNVSLDPKMNQLKSTLAQLFPSLKNINPSDITALSKYNSAS